MYVALVAGVLFQHGQLLALTLEEDLILRIFRVDSTSKPDWFSLIKFQSDIDGKCQMETRNC